MVMDPKMSVGLDTPSVNINLSSTWMPSLATPSLKLPTPILDGLGNGDWGQPSATTGTAGGGGLLSATGPGLLGSGMSPRLMLESLRMSPGVSGSIAPNMDAPKASTASLAELFICSEYMPGSSPQAAPNSSTPMSKPVPTLPTSMPQSQGMTYSQPQSSHMSRLPAKPATSQPQQASDRSNAQLPKSEPQTRDVNHNQKMQQQMQRHQQQQEQQRQHHQQQQYQQHHAQHMKRDQTHHQMSYQQHHQDQQRYQAQSLPMPAMLRQQALSSGMAYSQQLTNPYSQPPNPDRLPPHAQRLALGSSHSQIRGPVHPGTRALPDHRVAHVGGAIPPPGMHPPPQPTLKRMPGMPGMPGMPNMHGEPTGPSSSAIDEAKQLAQEKADKFAQKRKRTRKQVEEEKPKDVDTEEDKKLSPADLKKKRYNRRLELNRQSAAVSRVRRRAYVEELEGKLMHVEKEKLNLEDQVNVMHSENVKLREQMRQLHEQLSGTRGNPTYPPASMSRQEQGKQ